MLESITVQQFANAVVVLGAVGIVGMFAGTLLRRNALVAVGYISTILFVAGLWTLVQGVR